MLRVIALIAGFTMAALAGAAPIPKSMKKTAVDWIPFEVGNKWEYTSTLDTTGTIVDAREVTAVESKDGGLNVTQQLNGSTQTYRKDDEGVAVTGMNKAKYKNPRFIIKPGMKEGDTWNWDAGGYIETRTVGKIETVTVPAGEFEAIPIKYEYVQNGAAFQSGTVWYSSGVGLVKIDYEGYSYVLKNYTAGGKSK